MRHNPNIIFFVSRNYIVTLCYIFVNKGRGILLPLPVNENVLTYIFFKNATYPLYASYTSALLVTSQGACIDNTATPLSMTSMP